MDFLKVYPLCPDARDGCAEAAEGKSYGLLDPAPVVLLIAVHCRAGSAQDEKFDDQHR